MVTDKQVKILMTQLNHGKPLYLAAALADMDIKTARKWANSPHRPSETTTAHDWRTREDLFSDVWDDLAKMLGDNPGLQAKTLFEYLQRQHPGRFQDSQLRTLQRRVKHWRATHGPDKEVFFPQEHHPGEVGASDFTHMNALGIRIAGQEFAHLLYHFVLTYSNWETVRICFSESLEALCEGLQGALFELGGVPKFHRTDRLGAAVLNWSKSVLAAKGQKERARADFTTNYQRLLDHYGLQPQRTQAGHGNENGDAEQRHHRLKQAIEQALLLRGSRDFDSREAYEQFLRTLLTQLNAGRQQRLLQEKSHLAALPNKRLDALRILEARVGPASTLYLLCNVYSVPSSLIGEKVQAKIGAETIAIYLGKTLVQTLPRLRGRGQHKIEYRHIIGWLVRKPGAFANYRYRADLFPSSRFRMAYDALRQHTPASADREYLQILHLAATVSQIGVEEAIEALLSQGEKIHKEAIQTRLEQNGPSGSLPLVEIEAVDLACYDQLLDGRDRGREAIAPISGICPALEPKEPQP